MPLISLRSCLERLKAPRACGFGVGALFFVPLFLSLSLSHSLSGLLNFFSLLPSHPDSDPLSPSRYLEARRGVMASSFRFCPKFMAAIKSIDSPDLPTLSMPFYVYAARSKYHSSERRERGAKKRV